MKKLIDQRMTAASVVTLSLLWGACANSTSRAPETAGGSQTEVSREELVIRRVLLAVPNEQNLDVTEQVRPILESGDNVKVRPGLFGPNLGLQEEKNVSVGVFYTLRGKRYCSGFHHGQELSRAALLKDALDQYNHEPTHTLSKWATRGISPYVELRPTRTRLSLSSTGTREEPRNRVWVLKEDGSVLRQRSVSYFSGGTGILGPDSIVYKDEFEFDSVTPDELRALVISDDKGVVCFELKPEDWRERPKPWTMSHW